MKALGVWALLLASSAFAGTIEKCGVYSVEGSLTRKVESGGERLILIAEKDSNSETIFDLGKPSVRFKPYLDTNVSLEVRVDQPCQYRCRGKVVKFKKALEPFETPQAFFFPKPVPIIETRCK